MHIVWYFGLSLICGVYGNNYAMNTDNPALHCKIIDGQNAPKYITHKETTPYYTMQELILSLITCEILSASKSYRIEYQDKDGTNHFIPLSTPAESLPGQTTGHYPLVIIPEDIFTQNLSSNTDQ